MDEQKMRNDEMEALADAPLCLRRMVYNDNKIIKAYISYILRMGYQNEKPPKSVVAAAHRMKDVLEQTLPLYKELAEIEDTL